MSNHLSDQATILIHAIFSTRNQEHLIEEEIAPLLYTCVEGTLFGQFHSPALKTGGGSDHVHILLGLSRIVSPDALIHVVKNRSADFIRSFGGQYADFEWQEGYAIFTVGRSQAEEAKAYITNQREYHKTTSFRDEYRSILTAHGIEYDEKEMWD